jgi:hypothetical protein
MLFLVLFVLNNKNFMAMTFCKKTVFSNTVSNLSHCNNRFITSITWQHPNFTHVI